MTPEERARLLAANKAKGALGESRNAHALKYMTKLAYDRQRAMPGTRPDFVIIDKAGNIRVIQEVKTGGIRGTKGYLQMQRQIAHAQKHGAKCVLVYPGGIDGLRAARNVSTRVKEMIDQGVKDRSVIVTDANKLVDFKPLINELGGKVKTLQGTPYESRTAKVATPAQQRAVQPPPLTASAKNALALARPPVSATAPAAPSTRVGSAVPAAAPSLTAGLGGMQSKQ